MPSDDAVAVCPNCGTPLSDADPEVVTDAPSEAVVPDPEVVTDAPSDG